MYFLRLNTLKYEVDVTYLQLGLCSKIHSQY